MPDDEERIALFLDFENLAIGARERGDKLNVKAIIEALSERGRVIVRRAYADWNLFADHRRDLVAEHIEMIEIPQFSGMVRKNAADIQLAVDATGLTQERDFITTFVIASGDSDFTPLVLDLRARNKRVIGVGVEGSTSELLPGACDEFLFYERLIGHTPTKTTARRRRGKKADAGSSNGSGAANGDGDGREPESDLAAISRLITGTLSGLQRSADRGVLSSMLKRAIRRKDPTFTEGDYGFRSWGELMRHLESQGIIQLTEGSAEGDPFVDFPSDGGGEGRAFEVLRELVDGLEKKNGAPPLSGLKDKLRKRLPNFSEKEFGYGGFLQFVKAASARGIVNLDWDDSAEDYLVTAGQGQK